MMVAKQVLCSLVLLLALLHNLQQYSTASGTIGSGFAGTSGTQFVINGHPFYPNGFNAYWMMVVASDPAERTKVTSAFQQASDNGMSLVRTWAFSDGGYNPLQYSPGYYNEDMFKGLDFVISEAERFGVYLILSLVNNYDDFGGKSQYVQWARDLQMQGGYLSSDDEFYRNIFVKELYKNHVQTVVTRKNTITGVLYKDDPTIFAWELMNEPRCESDLSGQTLQEWVEEMAAHVKSIDSNHLVEVGLEGFYGDSMPERKRFNLGQDVGSDFIANNNVAGIDFVTIHAYPDQWMIPGSSEKAQLSFLQSWIRSHAQDARSVIGKPLMITEFGTSSSDCTQDYKMAAFYGTVYQAIYASVRNSGACVGGLFWQLLMPGMDQFRDDYDIILSDCPAMADFISLHSTIMASLNVRHLHQHEKLFVIED